MTLTIELEPDVEAGLARQAATQGEDTAAYALRVLSEIARHEGGILSREAPRVSMTPAERVARLDSITRIVPGSKGISDEHLRREYMYADRDDRQR
ncbi:MAG TPA: hypothetical protein VGK19_00785 [Capsulimonadaceae bacterium]|jgi:hypothetical protein